MRELLEQIAGLLLIAQGFYLWGVSFVVMLAYYRSSYRKHPRLFAHVSAVSLSYLIFTTRGLWAIWSGVVSITDPWLYAMIVGFGFGNYALLKVAQRVRNSHNGAHGEKRA